MTQTETAAPPEPVDWELAERVARRFAGREPIAASYLGGSLHSDFSAVTTQAEELVAGFTGLHAPGTASACVLDRPQWVHANVGSMRRMLHPSSRRAESQATSSSSAMTRRPGTEASSPPEADPYKTTTGAGDRQRHSHGFVHETGAAVAAAASIATWIGPNQP